MSRTKPVDRLLRARQYVRDAAAERLEAARQRLQHVLDEQSRLTSECRERVVAASGEGEAVTAGQLQTMADACMAAGQATCVCSEEMEEAREEAMASYRKLRQVEVLRERAREVEKVERRRKERKELDAIAGRSATKLVLPVLLLLVALGCQKEADPAEAKATPDAGVIKSDAELAKAATKAAAAKKPKKKLDVDELFLLRKLKSRRQELDKMKGDIELREAKLKLLQTKADKTLGEVKKIQGQIIKRVTGVSPTPLEKKKVDASLKPARPVKNVVDLNKVLKKMNTRAAASMLAEVDPDIAARAVQHMTPKKASSVLAQMEPDRAALLAERLSRKEKKAGEKEPAEKKQVEEKKPAEAAAVEAPKKKRKRRKRRRRRPKKAPAKMVKVDPEKEGGARNAERGTGAKAKGEAKKGEKPAPKMVKVEPELKKKADTKKKVAAKKVAKKKPAKKKDKKKPAKKDKKKPAKKDKKKPAMKDKKKPAASGSTKR